MNAVRYAEKNAGRWALLALLGLFLASPGSSIAMVQERDTAREAVTNLKAYAAYKMGQFDEAREIWEKLAEKGNTTALINLANMFQQAQGVDENQQLALGYVRKAAEIGDSRAQYELGMAYERGVLVERDLSQAATWFEKSAQQGDIDGQFALGVVNATAFGKGLKEITPEQRQQAITWLERANAQGHREAKDYLVLLAAKEPTH